jgi:hypothetical protein
MTNSFNPFLLRANIMKNSNRQNTCNSALLVGTLLFIGLGLLSSTASAIGSVGNHRLFVTSAVENTADNTVKLPLYRGLSQGQTVWYVVLDASNGDDAKKYGVNRADKLNNAKNTAAGVLRAYP